MTLPAPLVAVVGNPNAGKSALFNALTGARQKVGNYPGVTVERKSGRAALPDGRPVELVDLPGTYALEPSSPDEAVTRNVLGGHQAGERKPDALLVVVDASNLDNHLRFALELRSLGLPMVVALNMIDMAARDGLTVSAEQLSQALGLPVVETVAVRRRGLDAVREALEGAIGRPAAPIAGPGDLAREARRIAAAAIVERSAGAPLDPPPRPRAAAPGGRRRHPRAGDVRDVPGGVRLVRNSDRLDRERRCRRSAPSSPTCCPKARCARCWSTAIIGGVGAVVVFLPQILILFLFILLLEGTGYMVRAAFLMDRLMGTAGLSGRAFIPLLSSFACAVPGIMATRTIDNEKDRLTTILVAPLMTCSARLPVYTLIIAAFIPHREIAPFVNLQGVVMFGLYLAGIVGALLAALALRKTVARGAASSFMMELPKYQMPALKDVALGLWQRTIIFLKRAGGIILVTTVLLWALASFPKAGPGESQTEVSIAGRIASGIEVVVKPIGFNHDIALALLPSMAAREVAVSAIATVYALNESDEAQLEQSLAERLRGAWPLPTALAFLAWFVFAPQCISTIAVTRRETNSWRWPLFMVTYLFVLAYIAAGATYWTAVALGL